MIKLGDFGLAVQLEHSCSKRNTQCGTSWYIAPERYKGATELKSDVWSLGTALLELMGITPYYRCDDDRLPTMKRYFRLPFHDEDIESANLTDYLKKCFEKIVCKRWSVSELMNVSVMGWRMMSSIHL